MANPTPSTSYNAYAPLPRSYSVDTSLVQPEAILDMLDVSPTTQMNKVKGKYVALENPPRESDTRRKAKARAAEEVAKTRRAKIRGAKNRGLLPKDKKGKRAPELTWDALLPLHRLWLGYMAELLEVKLAVDGSAYDEGYLDQARSSSPASPNRVSSAALRSANWLPRLVKADYLGCMLSVKRAANSSLIGLFGIVVQETEGTFSIVMREKGVKVLPKQDSIFTFALPLAHADAKEMLTFDISGSQFAHRSVERAGRKFKSKAGTGEFAPWDLLDGTWPP